MSRARQPTRYVVVRDNCYLRSLTGALNGKGLAGGAYTTDVRKAHRYTAHQTARSHARQIGGQWGKLDAGGRLLPSSLRSP